MTSSTLGTRALYGTMRALARLACRLPRRAALAAGAAVGAAAWRIYRLTPLRDFVPGNVAAAFPEWSARAAVRTGHRSLALLGKAIVEVMRFARWPAEADGIVGVSDPAPLREAMARGRGAVIVTAHFGNWELLGAALARHFGPVSVLVQTPSRDAFARLFVEQRHLVGVETYSNTGPQALRPVLRALRRGEIVGLLCDQHGEAREVQATFLGHRVWVPLGPFTLARRTGAAVVPARIVRGPDDRHAFELEPELPVTEDDAANAQAMVARFEAWIRERPDHWLWPHNRFERAEPPGGGREAWRRRTPRAPLGARAVALALALALALELGWAPGACALQKPIVLALPDRLEVLDTANPDTHGAIPLPGRAEAALFVPSRETLVVHMPGAGALSLVDLKPFSARRYQAFETFRAPELAAYDLGIAEIAGKVLLGYGKTPLAVLDIATWKLEVGFDRPESIPYPFSSARVLYLPGGVFTLKGGQVTFESMRLDPLGHAATPRSIQFRHQPRAMVAGPAGRHLYVALGDPGARGGVVDLDIESRAIRRELPTPGPLSAMVWVDDRTLAVLSGDRLGLVDVHRWRLSRWFPIKLRGGPPIALLPAHVPRSAESR